MEFSVSTRSLDDAEDLFIVAKERMLDINDWQSEYCFTLTDSHKQKMQRNAHTGDFIKKDTTPEEWYIINKIQYDDYPDIAGESITLFISNVNDVESMHSIALNRVGKLLTVQGHNLDFTGNGADFLKRLLYTEEYAIAS
jgi:hypothetical protein